MKKKQTILALAVLALAVCCSGRRLTPAARAENLAGVALVELGGEMSALPLGVRVEGSVVTIESAGVYAFTGALDGGQIVVDAGKKGEVTLILNGVSIANAQESAILVEKAARTTIRLAAGSVNRVQSGETAALDGSAIDADASGGAISAKSDLVIEGEGALFVGGYLNNGVHTSQNLTVSGGKLEIEAANNGLKGKNSVTICGGDIAVRAGGNGVVSDSETGEDTGWVLVTGGALRVESAGDAVQAETMLDVTGGEITAIAGGGSVNAAERHNDSWGFGGFGGRGGMGGRGMGGRMRDNNARGMWGNAGKGGMMPQGEAPDGGMPGGEPPQAPDGEPPQAPDGNGPGFGVPGEDAPDARTEEQTSAEKSSAKGLKAGTLLRISGGRIEVDAADDALHANGSVEITGGVLTLSTGDDGVHADECLTIDAGEVRVLTSYEGLEANQIVIAGGVVEVNATDDGLNANGGQAMWGWHNPSERDDQEDGDMPNLLITGGTVYVNAQGDGLDSNGNLIVEGGLVVVDGPSGSGNGALDAGTESGGVCVVRGGTVLAIGSRGMAETFGDGSAQVSFEYSFDRDVAAGSTLTIAAADATVLFEHTAAKAFASVVFSSPKLTLGESVTITADGQSAEISLDSISSQTSRSRGFGWR